LGNRSCPMTRHGTRAGAACRRVIRRCTPFWDCRCSAARIWSGWSAAPTGTAAATRTWPRSWSGCFFSAPPISTPAVGRGADSGEYRLEKRYLHGSGGLRWGELNVAAVRGPDGALQYLVVHVLDITERKHAESALELSEEERLRLHAQVLHAQKLESLGVLAG